MGRQSREKIARRNFAHQGEDGREKSKFKPHSGLEKICLFVIQWGAYLAIFVPLAINTKFFFPFVAPKTILFRILVEVILVAYIFLVMKNKAYWPKITPLTIAVVLFVAIFILASFTGINLHRSFWSTNERMTGILTMLHLLAFFIILTSVWKERKDWEKVLSVSVIVGVILSIYILRGNEASTRGGGTIGNTSFMAAYLLFDVFFAIMLFCSNFLKKGSQSLFWQIFLGIAVFLPALLIALAIQWPLWGQILLGAILFISALLIEKVFRKGEWSLFWQIFSGLSLVIMIPVLLNSTGRGAIVAFLGGLFLLGLGCLLFSQKIILKRIALAIIIILVILSIALAVFQPSFVKNEISTILIEMKSRFVVWETGWKGFLERPILGWGPENFIVVFSKNFNACMFLSECGNEIWFDRVHNIVLDTMVTTGIIGLLSYLAIFIIAIYGLFKITLRVIEKRNILFPLGLIVILLSYFFQNLLVFDMINTYLVFFLTLGFINFLIQNQTQKIEETPQVAKPLNPIFASMILATAVFVLWSCNVQPLLANHDLIKSINSRDMESASLFFKKSLDSEMEKYEPREYFAQKIARIGTQDIQDEAVKKVFIDTFNLAESEMVKSVKENSLDFRPRLYLGQLYLQSYRLSGDQEKIIQADEILSQAIGISPTNQQAYWNLAEVKLAQRKIGETISLLQQAVALEPRLGYSHWYLAMAYQIAGQDQLAKEELIITEEMGYIWQDNIQELKKAIEIYDALGEDEGLLPLYLKATELEPENAQLWAELAAVYANLGQFGKAAETARKVIELNPDLAPTVQNFLKNLPQ
ncbi:MAG: O-antigen ligase family protein [Candidatus Nealsonbacteria bacterium]